MGKPSVNVRSDVGRWAMVPEWFVKRLDTVTHPKALEVFVRLAIGADRGSQETVVKRATIAEWARCSVKTVDRCLAHLVDVQAIQVEERYTPEGDRAANQYLVRFSYPQVGTLVTLPPDTGDATGGDTGDAAIRDSQRNDLVPEAPSGLSWVDEEFEAQRGWTATNLKCKNDACVNGWVETEKGAVPCETCNVRKAS